MKTPARTAQTVADLGEHAAHRADPRPRARPAAWVTVGIGDDAAVVEPARNRLEVMTTDALVEGVHFDRRVRAGVRHRPQGARRRTSATWRRWAPRRGRRCSRWPCPARCPWPTSTRSSTAGSWPLAHRHRRGAASAATSRGRQGRWWWTSPRSGRSRPRRVLTRGAAKPGDAIYVSGTIGAAAAGLCGSARRRPRRRGGRRGRPRCLRGAVPPARTEGPARTAARPEPCRRRPCVDLSDGLGGRLRQVAAASRVGRRHRRRRGARSPAPRGAGSQSGRPRPA